MMTDIHKQRDTYEHILEGKHHIWPSFFFPRGETSENRHLHVFFFFVLTGTRWRTSFLTIGKNILKFKKKNSILLVTDVCLVGGRFLLAFWD